MKITKVTCDRCDKEVACKTVGIDGLNYDLCGECREALFGKLKGKGAAPGKNIIEKFQEFQEQQQQQPRWSFPYQPPCPWKPEDFYRSFPRKGEIWGGSQFQAVGINPHPNVA